jgi:hypothetical protein
MISDALLVNINLLHGGSITTRSCIDYIFVDGIPIIKSQPGLKYTDD